MQMIATSTKYKLHIQVERMADEKQILINWSLNEKYNSVLIVCGALFPLLPAEKEVFLFLQYIARYTWGHFQMQMNTFIEE